VDPREEDQTVEHGTTYSLPRFQRPIKSGGWAADMDPVKEKVH
jgi:hypothetical protein